jgi:predicted phosphohydrolase
LEFVPDLDFLLLPGDLTVSCSQGKDKTKLVLDYLSGKARHCVFLCGNHEYYHGTKEAAEGILESVMPYNFHWLRNTLEVIDGIKFFGGTMWFPDAPHNKMYEDQLSDFLVIKDFKKWVYEENKKFNEAARSLITDETIVLTHHLPAYRVVAPVFQGDNLNRFFVCEMTDLILDRKPPLWVYGHTHLPADDMIGATRVVCFPYGYPSECPLGPKSYKSVVFEI